MTPPENPAENSLPATTPPPPESPQRWRWKKWRARLAGGAVALAVIGMFFVPQSGPDFVVLHSIKGFGLWDGLCGAINDTGEVVFSYHTHSRSLPHLFHWNHATGTRGIPISPPSDVRINKLKINNAGHVVGEWHEHGNGPSHAFFWDKADGLHTLDMPISWVSAINDTGQIVGGASGSSDVWGNKESAYSFLWDKKTGVHKFHTDTSSTGTGAPTAINNHGEITGWYFASAPFRSQAFFWTKEGGRQDIATPPNGTSFSAGMAITDAGAVFGVTGDGASQTNVFRWCRKTAALEILGALPQHIMPSSINRKGQLIGRLSDPRRGDLRFWDKDTGTHEIKCPPGFSIGDAFLNDTGLIAGTLLRRRSNSAEEECRAFVWTRESGLQLLEKRAASESTVLALNNTGQIVGQLYHDAPWWKRAWMWCVERLGLPDHYQPDCFVWSEIVLWTIPPPPEMSKP